VRNVARWTGSQWVAVGTGLGGTTSALLSHGGYLFAGGSFRALSGAPSDRIAVWDGSAWAAVGGASGFDRPVLALAPDGDGVIAAGDFLSVGDVASAHFARFVLDDPSGTTTTSSTVTTSTSTSTTTSTSSSTSSTSITSTSTTDTSATSTSTTSTSATSTSATSTSSSTSSTSSSTSSSTTTTLPAFTDEPLPGSKLVLKAKRGRPDARSVKLIARVPALTVGDGNGSADDPTLAGGTLSLSGGGASVTFTLDAAEWRYLHKAGADKGYKLRHAGPVRTIVVKRGKLLKVSVKSASLPWDLETSPAPIDVALTLGAHRYCWRFGGSPSLKPGRRLRLTNAAAPVDCSSGSVSGAFVDR
jgi:hypothetical protein